MRLTVIATLMLGVSLLASETSQSAPTLEEIANQNAFGGWQGKVASASVDSGPFLDLSFLYLKSEIGGLTFGQKTDIGPLSPNASIDVKGRPIELDFEWDPGLHVGIGYIFPSREQWQLSGYWTYLHSDIHKSVSKGGDINSHYIAPLWHATETGSIADRASARWTLNFNVLDIALSRNAFFGKWLSLAPQIGVRAAWIYQDFETKYHAGFPINVAGNDVNLFLNTSFSGDNDFWGAGARIGSALLWYITRNLSLEGNFFASLLYGQFDIKQFIVGGNVLDLGGGPQMVELNIDGRREIDALRGALETELGLRWHRFFRDDAYRLLIGVLYQFSYWFDQNELVNVIRGSNTAIISPNNIRNGDPTTYVPVGGNLELQGLRVELRLDF